MPGQQQQPKGPSAEGGFNALNAMAALAGPVMQAMGMGRAGDIAGIANGLGGSGKELSGGGNIIGYLGGLAGIGSAGYNMLGNSGVSNVLGGVNNVGGIITGLQDAADSKKSAPDRVVGALDATANGLSLGGLAGGFSLTGAGVGGAATMGGSSLAAIGGAGAATIAGSAGAVLGAGVAGYKVGSVINDVANSDWARAPGYGQDQWTGRNRTASDVVIDTMVDFNLGADRMGRNANASMDAAGARAGNWINNATGTQFMGNAVSGAMDYAGGAAEAVMDYGGGFLGGVGTAVGSVPAAFMGLGTAGANYVSSWFD